MNPRVIVRIVGASEDRLLVRVSAWSTRENVSVPRSLVPVGLPVTVGSRLVARVNIGAERGEELEFTDFEIAPEPVPWDELS